MATRDYDKLHRQKRVYEQGAERNEGPDLTRQIATAKGLSKTHGPWNRACPACGKYYPEDAQDDHARVCRPPPKAKKVVCRICHAEVDRTCIRDHLRYYHPRPKRPNPRRKRRSGPKSPLR